MEETLTLLNASLKATLYILKGSANAELLAALHDHDKLPDKKMAGLAYQAVDLLHEIEQLLEPGPLVLADHFFGYVNCKCLCAAVELNIPDILHQSSRSLQELATVSSARPDRLRQVLRVLYSNGIFSYNVSTDTYSNNPTSTLLLSDHWTQWRNWVDLYGNEFYDMARGIPQSCCKDVWRMPGQINYDTDKDMFTYFVDKGLLPRMHRTLSGGAVAQSLGILEDYPWEEVADTTVFDVGGGAGGLVASLLRKHKSMQAGILDISEVINRAELSFHTADGEYADVGDRVPKTNLIAGDFLLEIPRFEVYTMKWCLHDWNDPKALKLLTNIRRSIVRGSRSRLVVLESLLSDGRIGRLSRYADITMMVSANGQERTEAEWRALAEKTGWMVNRICPLRNAWPCAIEFVPVWDDVTSDHSGESKNHMDGPSDTCYQSEMKNHVNGTDDPLQHSKSENLANSTGNTYLNSPEKALAYSIRKVLKESGASEHIGSDKVHEIAPRQVISQMRYLESWNLCRGSPFCRSAPAEGFKSTNFQWVDHEVKVTNARPIKHEFDINRQAFQFCDDVEGVSPELLNALQLDHKRLVEKLYYPRIEKLLKAMTGASRVIIFDHTVRIRDPGLKSNENPNGREQPATMVHCDHSAKGALRRLKQNIPDNENVDEILKGRVQMINVWRPLNGPVQDWPLAMMDYRSLSLTNSHPCDLWRGEFEERGQTVAFEYADDQRWYYLDGHRSDEFTLIKIWDSRDNGEAKFCPHAAFKHPDTPLDTAPRESVEVRCLVMYEPNHGSQIQ